MTTFDGRLLPAARLAALNEVIPLGTHVEESDTGRVKRGTGQLRWNDLPYWDPNGDRLAIVKTADETVNNTGTTQADDHLFFRIKANETWVGEFTLFIEGDATADFQADITVPSGDVVYAAHRAVTASTTVSTTVVEQVSGTSLAGGMGADPGGRMSVVRFFVANGATAGKVQLNWAQNTATVADTTLLAGSYLTATRVR